MNNENQLAVCQTKALLASLGKKDRQNGAGGVDAISPAAAAAPAPILLGVLKRKASSSG